MKLLHLISSLSLLSVAAVSANAAHPNAHQDAGGKAANYQPTAPNETKNNDADETAAESEDTVDDSAKRYTHNGFGRDIDGDKNPATATKAISRIGSAAEAAFDPPYQVVTFEATPTSGHDEKIIREYKKDFGVTFSKGLTRQICEGQRYFQYNSACTYLRAPSGKYAAVYRDDFNRPLQISFDQQVCVAAMAIYPTGGKEGEKYQITLQAYDAAGAKLKPAKTELYWTKDTFRWRHMAGAYFLETMARRVDVSIKSLDQPKKTVRFLIDDLAFVANSCAGVDGADPAAVGS